MKNGWKTGQRKGRQKEIDFRKNERPGRQKKCVYQDHKDTITFYLKDNPKKYIVFYGSEIYHGYERVRKINTQRHISERDQEFLKKEF